MTTEQYSIGYDQGYQDGMNDALAPQPVKQEQAEQKPVATIAINNWGEFKVIRVDLPEGKHDLYAAPVQQAEQEPVAWKHDCAALCANDVELWIDNCPHCGKPRTAAPVRTKDLTDDEIAAVTGYRKSGATWPVVKEVARAVIAKFKEKNK